MAQQDRAALEELKKTSPLFDRTLALYDRWGAAGISAYDAARAARLYKLGCEAGELSAEEAASSFAQGGNGAAATASRELSDWGSVWENFLDGKAWADRTAEGAGESERNRFREIALFYPELFDDALLAR